MLICSRCHTRNLDIASFCKECGSNDLYDPQAEEKREKERQRQEELKRAEEERQRIQEAKRQKAREERERRIKQTKEFFKQNKYKLLISGFVLVLAILVSLYQYYYGGKYSRVYMSNLEKQCYTNDEKSCEMLRNIYKEKCDGGEKEACLNAFIHNHKDLKAIKVNDKWNLVNENNETIANITDLMQSYARIKLNGKWGFMDKNGEIILKPQFDYANSFYEGLAPVELNKKWGLIDKSGKIVIKPQFDFAWSFNEGLAGVELKGEIWFCR
ncbi:WG repeat-containing protein [Helicobacter sp. CaF467b]|uniref:WG repeat-containing protein n=1 Tax=Helicobacter sp. CaF467b TaxID=2919923 RepID=UPI001F583456|nr:WG repeat-containing protein [Helicobacter sp. CaF467b]MCI2236209.1 WG repeat-containing protein [Helicobacter sp. CaF467b]